MSYVSRKLQYAETKKWILPTSLKNVLLIYNQRATPDWAKSSIEELVDQEQWKEIDDRFYKILSFGTGGIRARTIGNVITHAEMGSPTESGRPQYPAIGTNMLNGYNISRAVQGLCAYTRKNFTPTEAQERPRIVLAHDVRHFSREFAELAAQIAQTCGFDVHLFEAARTTPELSFAIRHLNAQCGGVVTASHNPSYDNGFKVYYDDGAQIVEPHASGIINEVNAVQGEQIEFVADAPGKIHECGQELDQAYFEKLTGLLLDKQLVESQRDQFKIVFSPIHGTGGHLIPRLLRELGFNFSTVSRQMEEDGRFPTVKSPNPENQEALFLAIQEAENQRADLVVATDPDTDRMGVAVRDQSGKMVLLDGNQTGSLMAWYRTEKLFAQGVLTPENAKDHAALIKTIVTTGLQKSIADHFGVKLVETLTGFKYIAEKLGCYESQVREAKGMTAIEYRGINEKAKRDLLLKYSTYYIFGGEESYGYSASDFVRDKDANAAVLMFCEVAAYAKSKGITLVEMLDDIYLQLGYFAERLGQIVLEGAEGAGKIKKLLDSYADQPPTEFAGRPVVKVQRYDQDDICDVDGKMLPKELVHLLHFADGGRVAIRGSGTEPKVKYYLFTENKPASGARFSPEQLAQAKEQAAETQEKTWAAVEADALSRME